MRVLERIFSTTRTERNVTYSVTDVPPMPFQKGRNTLQPDAVLVTFEAYGRGRLRFRTLTIEGSIIGKPRVRGWRCCRRRRDVPDWARQYLTPSED